MGMLPRKDGDGWYIVTGAGPFHMGEESMQLPAPQSPGAGLGLEVLVTQGSAGRVPGGQLGQIQGKGSAAELLQQMGVTDVQDL